MGNSLAGKVAVVTGGSTGIGLGIARQLIAEGAHVFITGRREAELDAAVRTLERNVTAVRADVAVLSDLDALYAKVKAEKGRLDIVVANAGGGELVPLAEITEAHYDKTFDINVKGVLFTVQKALPLLTAGASVIVIGSTTSIKGTAACSVYSASKAAIRNFVRSWILDLAGKGIRVNVLSPGPVHTPALHGLVPADQTQGLIDSLTAQVPLGRIGEPDEIGQVALFLASEASSFVNGAELFADGGQGQI